MTNRYVYSDNMNYIKKQHVYLLFITAIWDASGIVAVSAVKVTTSPSISLMCVCTMSGMKKVKVTLILWLLSWTNIDWDLVGFCVSSLFFIATLNQKKKSPSMQWLAMLFSGNRFWVWSLDWPGAFLGLPKASWNWLQLLWHLVMDKQQNK